MMDPSQLKRLIKLQERLQNACQAELREKAKSLEESFVALDVAEARCEQALSQLRSNEALRIDELERRQAFVQMTQELRYQAQVEVGKRSQERDRQAELTSRARAELRSLELLQERQDTEHKRAEDLAEQRVQDDQNHHIKRTEFRKTGS